MLQHHLANGVERMQLRSCVRPNATFSTSGLSYLNVALSTVHKLYNAVQLLCDVVRQVAQADDQWRTYSVRSARSTSVAVSDEL